MSKMLFWWVSKVSHLIMTYEITVRHGKVCAVQNRLDFALFVLLCLYDKFLLFKNVQISFSDPRAIVRLDQWQWTSYISWHVFCLYNVYPFTACISCLRFIMVCWQSQTILLMCIIHFMDDVRYISQILNQPVFIFNELISACCF